jgi:hypothetical protein
MLFELSRLRSASRQLPLRAVRLQQRLFDVWLQWWQLKLRVQ